MQAVLALAPGVEPVAALTAPVPIAISSATPDVQVEVEGSADALARDVLSPVVADAGPPTTPAVTGTDASAVPQSAELLAVSSPMMGEAHDGATALDDAGPLAADAAATNERSVPTASTSPPAAGDPAPAAEKLGQQQQHRDWHWAKRVWPLSARGRKGAAKPPRPPTVPYFRLYRFATALDLLLLVVGVIAGIGMGSVQPLSLLFFGDIINAFSPTATGDELLSAVRTAAINLSILAGVAFVCGWAEVTIFTTTGLRQANRIRELYFQVLSEELRGSAHNGRAPCSGRVSIRVLAACTA